MTPDEQSLRTDLGSVRFLSGADRGYWRFNQLQWPHLYIGVTAQDMREFVLRLDCSGFPSSPPTGTFWDITSSNKLAFEKWPKGGERIRLAFRTDWQNGDALYIPCDRKSIVGHSEWPAQYPQLIWKPSNGISHYLEVVYDLLQSKDYIHAAAKSPLPLWKKLIRHLSEQSAGTRESGAFLLGHKTETSRVVTGFLPYEQLQADALHKDYVSLSAASFAKLWEVCRQEGWCVVADVHTHGLGVIQSRSDRTNPMVALTGHIALIVPNFAQGNIQLNDLGMYIYKGDHKWTTYTGDNVSRLVQLTDAGEVG